ncbi:hypothetical protein D3C72_1778870 [compost metagenome]
MASLSVSTRVRTLTNWLGNSMPSALGKTALSLTVPVVVSIWLSVVSSVPSPSWLRTWRSHACTGSFSPALSFFSTEGRLSSGMVYITAMGWICVISAMPLVSLVLTILPGSTWRRPMRPDTGATIFV